MQVADEATHYGSGGGGGGYVQGSGSPFSPFSQGGSPSGRVCFSLPTTQQTLIGVLEGRSIALFATVNCFTIKQGLTNSYRSRVEAG